MITRLAQISIGRNFSANHGVFTDLETLVKQGRLREALQILHGTNKYLNSATYSSLLRLCTKNKALAEGKLVHLHMDRTGFKPDTSVENMLVNMYTKCGSLEDAHEVFDKMLQRDMRSWTAMIAAYAKRGLAKETVELFRQMQRMGMPPNEFTLASIIPACAALGELHQAMEIQEHGIRSGFHSDVFVQTGLVDLYAKCGRVDLARQVFEKMPERDVHSWTAMISGYSKRGFAEDALALLSKMQHEGIQPNHFTIASVLPACGQLGILVQGIEIHERIIKSGFQSDLFVQSGLIDMYAKCGSLERAHCVFDKMPQQGLISWNAMIAGYAQNGYVEKAFDLFLRMPERDVVSWNVMVSGYVQSGHLDEAVELFCQMPERTVAAGNAIIAGYARNGLVAEAFHLFQAMSQHDEVSWNAMISAYAQNGYGEEALKLFQKMPNPDVVTWTALISGYAQNGQSVEALAIFGQMQLSGVKPDPKTFASVLSACANLAALEQGILIHEAVIIIGFQSVVLIQNALIDMYAKSGFLDKARYLFDKMRERNLVSWNAMISGYAIHGRGKEALELFEQMQQSGISPSHVTLVCVLCACCHAGLVDEGLQYFDHMRKYYNITPTMEHCVFMVDLLGRSGLLEKAEDFISKMPIQPEASVWRCLLAACRIHNNVKIGERAAERLFLLDSDNAANYVVMSNIYLAAGRWEDAENVRRMRKDRRIKKIPGCSWIEVDQQVHIFQVGDESPLQTPNVCETLKCQGL